MSSKRNSSAVLDRTSMRTKPTKSAKPKPARRRPKKEKDGKQHSTLPSSSDSVGLGLAAIVAVLTVTLAWSYWPHILEIVAQWQTQPDYSHGFLVIPIAIWFLWVKRDDFPNTGFNPAYSGLLLLGFSVALRFVGTLGFIDSVVGWSIIAWVAGVIVTLAGWRVFSWCLPSVVFLCFMIPLPFRIENALRHPLQRIATSISSGTLQILGYDAFAEANTIRIGDYQYGVDEACSGLRIFVGIVALAFAYFIVSRRPWWFRTIMLLAALPITLIANSTRIVATCLLWQLVSSDASHRFSHDIAGFVMIPFAAALFGLLAWYLSLLFREVDVVSVRDVIRSDSVGRL